MNILFLGRKIDISNGGGIVTKRNLDVLKALDCVDNVYEIFIESRSILRRVVNIITRKPLGFSGGALKLIDSILINQNCEIVFIEHSMLGGFAKLISRKHKDIKIISFFHNVEYDYYSDKVKIDGVMNYPMIYWAKQNETSIANHSHYNIVLTKRDADRLKLLYNINTSLILPITLKDHSINYDLQTGEDNFHLFVGSAFFANMEGISWYIENVLIETDSLLIIIGKGMESLKQKYSNITNLKILGFVENLDKYYVNADFIVNPVFSGSGMKTKTIEALKYGKSIIGTKEAFVGLHENLDGIAFECNDVKAFTKAIEKIRSELKIYKNNPLSRKLYEEHYSFSTTVGKLENFLIQID